MKFKNGIFSTLCCLALVSSAVAVPGCQEEPPKPEVSDTNKQLITVHISVSAEGMDRLPTGSTVELTGNDKATKAACRKVQSREQSIHSGEVTFSDVPICQVNFRFFVTGFESKTVLVDLTKHKEPLHVFIKKKGSPEVD
jgi:hypothetical protein